MAVRVRSTPASGPSFGVASRLAVSFAGSRGVILFNSESSIAESLLAESTDA